MDRSREETKGLLQKLIDRANESPITPLRLKHWHKSIEWQVGDDKHYWSVKEGHLVWADPRPTEITLRSSREVLEKIVSQRLPFFVAIWVTGDIQFDGSFADAYRLGYVFLNDARKRQVVFLAHCFLNINTRFPQGCAFPGANVPLVEALLQTGVGVVQMPCPEFLCLGLEKERYGEVPAEKLRACFQGVARGVFEQIQAYLDLGFEIRGIIGMNPSPSCGVESAKGKGTMLGLDRDTSEKAGPGLFIEELMDLAGKGGIKDLPFFGIRRVLPGEAGIDGQLETLRRKLHK